MLKETEETIGFFFFFFLHCPLFREVCGGSSSGLSRHTSPVFHHLQHFAWAKCQAIPSKILNVIGSSSSRSSNWSSPICFGKYKACLGSLSGGIVAFLFLVAFKMGGEGGKGPCSPSGYTYGTSTTSSQQYFRV